MHTQTGDRVVRPAPSGVNEPERLPPPSSARSGLSWLGKLLTWVCVLGVIGGLTWGYYVRIYLPGATPAAAPPKRPIPVLASSVRLGDMNLYLNALGTVTAFNSVVVRSRVEGELIRVAFTEGQIVQEGQVLAEIDPRPFEVQLRQAEGPLKRDEAAFEVAQSTLERFTQLAETKNISQQEIDTQTSLVKQAEGAVLADKAQIANATLQLEYCTIRSPITGRIGLRLVDRGNIIQANDPNGLAIVTQLQPISIIFTVPQDEIARVRRRMLSDSKLKVEAYNRDFSLKLAEGTLEALDNQVDSTTGTVRLKAKFENLDEMLFPNQFVNVRLLIDTQSDVVIAPAAAVQRGPNFTFAYVLKADSTVELRKVTLGPGEGLDVIVTEGLSPGERVVTDGLEKLQPGATVALREAKPKTSAATPTPAPVDTSTTKTIATPTASPPAAAQGSE